ncbi:MAG: hypothetical protein M3Y56_08805, partial [Armatimonadota bacterium]|nr:hypothetical protein [Armatimonadota bacterium]
MKLEGGVMDGGLLDGGLAAKELTTQCLVVLLKDELGMEELERSLQSFPGGMRRPPHEAFEYGGPSLLVPFRPEVNGFVSAEIVNHPWPDREGDPKTEKLLVASWILGFFGPLTYPGALRRAGEHSLRWEPGRTIAKRHTG